MKHQLLTLLLALLALAALPLRAADGGTTEELKEELQVIEEFLTNAK